MHCFSGKTSQRNQICKSAGLPPIPENTSMWTFFWLNQFTVEQNMSLHLWSCTRLQYTTYLIPYKNSCWGYIQVLKEFKAGWGRTWWGYVSFEQIYVILPKELWNVSVTNPSMHTSPQQVCALFSWTSQLKTKNFLPSSQKIWMIRLTKFSYSNSQKSDLYNRHLREEGSMGWRRKGSMALCSSGIRKENEGGWKH